MIRGNMDTQKPFPAPGKGAGVRSLFLVFFTPPPRFFILELRGPNA